MSWQRVPAERRIDATDKSLPAWAAGMSAAEFVARAPRLSDLWTPSLVVDDAALTGNAAFLAGWARQRGLELMPHGKTTMAPQLWRLQRDAGATGITLATPWQVRVAREAGIGDVMLANQLVDPAAVEWLAGELTDGSARVWSWIDDDAGVAALAGRARERPFEVLVELGRDGGRTGIRGLDAGMRLAERIAATPGLRLAGVAGYEGAIAQGRSAGAVTDVAAFVRDLVELHGRLLPLYDTPADAIVTAGGSAYPDVVAGALAESRLPGRYVIRSGASLIHDEGFYRSISPFEGAGLRPAARAVARVVSAPEPGLALLDAGRRDVPYDLDLPVPLAVLDADGTRRPLTAEVTAVNDQHAFLRTSPDDELVPGDRVLLGLSHPCTMFDKWRLIPVVDSLDAPDPLIVGLIETRF